MDALDLLAFLGHHEPSDDRGQEQPGRVEVERGGKTEGMRDEAAEQRTETDPDQESGPVGHRCSAHRFWLDDPDDPVLKSCDEQRGTGPTEPSGKHELR